MNFSTRLMLAMIAVAVITAAIIGSLTYRNIAAIALPSALERISTRATLAATELEAYVRGARGDVSTQGSGLTALIAAMTADTSQPHTAAAAAAARNRLASRFVAELQAKPGYAMLRLIGAADGGREIVRVDRLGPHGEIRVVQGAALQRQGDRDYFKAAMALPRGGIFASDVDLSENDGAIAVPHVPILRVAAPAFAADGTPFGILIVDIDLRAAFATLRSMMRSDSAIYVVNEQGDYLLHPNRSKEFAFKFGTPSRIQSDFPEIAGMLAAGNVTPRIVSDRHGDSFGIGWHAIRLAGGPRTAVIEAVPYQQVAATRIALRDSILVAGVIAVFGAILFAFGLARSTTRPLIQMTAAVENFTAGKPMAAPLNAGGEVGRLAHAFQRMADEIAGKTAALMKEVEERRRILENSLDLILVVDSRGNVIEVSPSSLPILGYRNTEMIGRNAIDFIYPGDLEATRIEMRAGRRGLETRNFDSRYVHKDGRIVMLAWTGVWSEEVRQHFFIGRDVTEQRLSQEALRESEQMSRGIIDTALDAFVQLDEASVITDWNAMAETMFGWSREEAIGRRLTDLIIPPSGQAEHWERHAQFMREATEGVAGRRFEIQALRRDGKPIWVEAAVTVLRRRSGLVSNGFFRDLTGKRAAEDQLRQAQKMEAVGQLTGGIAHDFNNMLTVITGTIDLLGDAVADRPQLAAIAKLISEAAERGAELTAHLLAFARKQPLQPKEIDVNALIANAANLIRPMVGEAIEIRTRYVENAWPALIDPTQLTTALLNLASNARDAMPAGGKLTLETANMVLDEAYTQINRDVKPGDYVMIVVSDTGTGMPSSVREKIFEPFFSTKEVGKGTGLGLSMVYGFVKQSGGHLNVYSEEGHGTTFRIYLPRATAVTEADVVPEDAIEFGDETILVVEDDPLVRESVVTQLQALGYRALSANSPTAALEIVDSGAEFDLLFTDVIMPGGINGRQLAEQIARRRPNLKVLFTSGYTQDAIVHQGRLETGVLLLAKPYRKLDLARMLRRALAGAAINPGLPAGRIAQRR